MRFPGIIVIVYSILVLMGGLIGYLFADSLPSLIAGSVFGAVLFASGLGILRKSIIAFFTALTSSGILAAFFSYRYWETAKWMPAGMMALLSGIIFVMLLSTRAQRK
jgi:uncharacterized membrane protein (UPF0136 family)